MSIRWFATGKICRREYDENSVCYLYFLRFHACSFPWETNEKHSSILSLGRPVPVQRPFSRDNLLYRANQCWFVVITSGHWKLENCNRAKREGQFFFFNFLEFSMLQRKNFVAFYKKKKVPSNFIDRFPVQQIFSRDDPFYHRANQCYHMPLNIRKLQSMKRIFLLFFFFSNFTRCSISKGNFIEFSFIDLRLFPLSHRRFTVLISHRIPENYIPTRTNGRIF